MAGPKASGIRLLDELRQDARYAVRSLRKNPTFALSAILTLALGIGANTAIFSVVHSVLLDPLPFEHGDRLVHLYENVPASESSTGRARRMSGMDVRELVDVRARTRTLSHITSEQVSIVWVAGADGVERQLAPVSAAALPMLGVQPRLGRWFTEEEERAGNQKVIVLSYGAWQQYFGGDPQVLGKTIAFNGNSFSFGVALGADYTVIGVMPPGFHFPDDNTQFWIPSHIVPPADGRPRRIGLVARLGDGVSPDAAAADVAAIVSDVRGKPLLTTSSGLPRFEFVRLWDEVGQSVRPALLVLTVAVGFVLLIACANVANLLLGRAVAREREIALRLAIGAGQGRLIRQLLTESIVLSLFGGIVGTALAYAGVDLFRRLATNLARIDLGSLGTAFPRLDAIHISAPTMGFTLAISVAAGLVFGLAPAVRRISAPHMDVLRGATGSTATGSSLRARVSTQSVLVVGEITLATLLFVCGGLLIRSFIKLTDINPGYDASHVLTLQVGVRGDQRPAAELKTFAEDLIARLQAVPGVEAAAYANQLPMVSLQNSMTLRTTPEPPAPSALPPPNSVDTRLVSADYLKAMGIRVIAGRSFGDSDGAGQPRAMIINRTLARRDFSDRNPIGAVVYMGRDTVPWAIVGVVDDVRQAGLDVEPKAQLFVNMMQWPGAGVPVFPAGAYYAIRTTGDPIAAIANVREVVRQLDARASLENIATMEQIVSNSLSGRRLYAVLLGVFAGIAVLLAAAGIYGVMAYSVAQRTRELGIRMALGAKQGQVLGMVLSQGATLTMIGIALGLGGAAGTTRYLRSMLYGLTPLDLPTFAVVALIFIVVATLAAYLPARHATKVDPIVALRCE